MNERLQKVLAHAGVASRRAAERMILEGRVRVNGVVITRLGTRVDPERDSVKVDGKRVSLSEPDRVYLMLHKPRGIVTTMGDPEGRATVRDLLAGVRARVYPVGRLDVNSEGLLLLTNDGDLARDLMHPSRRVPKTYRVKVRGAPDAEDLRRVSTGVQLEGRKTLPAQIETIKAGSNAWLQVTVVEGRKHLVRRLLEAVGHPVVKLRRIRYAGLDLGKLPPGRHRPLSAEEVRALRRAAGGGRGSGSA